VCVSQWGENVVRTEGVLEKGSRKIRGLKRGTEQRAEKSSCLWRINPLTPNDLQRHRAASPLKIKITSKICVKSQQIHQLFIQFINYVW
jgi:hypothetical protein